METENRNQREPLLSFEFADSNGEMKPMMFYNPIKIITATTLEEVLSGFHLIQNAVEHGYYAAGFLSYESAPAFDPAYRVREGNSMPLMWFGIFKEPQPVSLNSTGTFRLANWDSSVSTEEYQASISEIKDFIENGDTYQSNYTIRLNSEFQGDDIALFQQLKRAQNANYCAYINTGEHRILSLSPELFFHLEGEQITTRPMKGTAKRGRTFAEDEAIADWLYHSEKNRAENVMIVDLLRNDLNIIAEKGTVKVPKLFEIEHYPTVHQMTSTITAKVSKETKLIDIFKALFPCGSITGAPKISTMKIIEKLEKTPREVYCGAIGYITPNKEAIFNVPIRTLVINQRTGGATYGVGGGITWDSTAEDEYHEILAKASLLAEERPEFELLESLLLNEGEFFLMEEHLRRLQNTARYFGFPFRLEDVFRALTEFAVQHSRSKVKIRLLLDKKGEITLDSQPVTQFKTPLGVILADEPIDKNSPFLYHKTTNRSIYSKFQKKFPSFFDVLLYNTDGELTEFTNGNVVLEVDGLLWTPPVTSGLLAGTFREHLIKIGKVREKVLKVDDLEKCSKLWFINSVRKWIEVSLTKGPF